MAAAITSESKIIAGILGLVLGACGNSADGTAPGGASSTGGHAGSNSAGAAGAPQVSGGTSGTGSSPSARGGEAGLAGAPSAGGVTSSGGVGGANATTGGTSSSGGDASAGAGGSGGTGVSGGSAGTAAAGGVAGGGGSHDSGGLSGMGGRGGGGTGAVGSGGMSTGGRSISFGTLLDPAAVMSSAKALATSLANPSSAQWRAKGDQRRTYRFADAGKDEPYRICVPSSWDGSSPLPLVMFLHGSGSNESTYLDQNGKQLVNLAGQHGYLLVSPLGDQGAYGNFLRLTAPFGDEAGAAELMSQVTNDSERTNELSEQDIINVLELVLSEYPIDRGAMFLSGHSMGSGGTWYIGGKYSSYWKGIAPMSGPFVQKTGYPWDAVRKLALFVTEGTQAPSLDASRLLNDWLKQNNFTFKYKEVNADHGGMIPLVLPDIFDFFDQSR